jgi:hypothetical protein
MPVIQIADLINNTDETIELEPDEEIRVEVTEIGEQINIDRVIEDDTTEHSDG